MGGKQRIILLSKTISERIEELIEKIYSSYMCDN